MSVSIVESFSAEKLSPNPHLSLDIELNGHSLGDEADWESVISHAVGAAIASDRICSRVASEVFVELVSNNRSQELNRDYRGKDKPTNVLSFPGVEPEDLDDAIEFSNAGGPPVLLGDLIIAVDVVLLEATEQKKPVSHHFAHLIVHGVLHLLGHDHIEEDEAEAMEELERQILAQFDIPDPYREVV